MKSVEDALRRRLKENLDPLHAGPNLPGDVRRRARRGRAVALLACAVFVLGAGAVATGIVTALPDAPGPQPATEATPDHSDAPTVAEVVCTDEGAHTTTRYVRPQRDGVHIRIEDRVGGRGRQYKLRAPDDPAQNEGGDFAGGVASITSSYPPGDMLVGCFDDEPDPPYWETEGVGYALLTVVDPEGLWRDGTLACDPRAMRGTVLTDKPADESRRQTRGRTWSEVPSGVSYPELARRHVSGIRAGDVVAETRYPEGPVHFWSEFVVLRDEVPLARLWFVRGKEVWEIEVATCRGSGIGPG